MGQLDLKNTYTSSSHMTPRLCVPQAMSEASDGAPSRAGSLPTLASRNGSAQLPDGSGSPPATAPGTPAGPRSSHEAGRPSHEGARVSMQAVLKDILQRAASGGSSCAGGGGGHCKSGSFDSGSCLAPS